MNGKQYLLYTTEQGGYFKFAPGDPRDQFEAAKISETLDVTPNDVDRDHGEFEEPRLVGPRYMMLVEVVDNYDFALCRSRDEAPVSA